MNPRLWPSMLRINHAMGLFCCRAPLPLFPTRAFSFILFSIFIIAVVLTLAKSTAHCPPCWSSAFWILNIGFTYFIASIGLDFAGIKGCIPTDLGRWSAFLANTPWPMSLLSRCVCWGLIYESLGLLRDWFSLEQYILIRQIVFLFLKSKKKKYYPGTESYLTSHYAVLSLCLFLMCTSHSPTGCWQPLMKYPNM